MRMKYISINVIEYMVECIVLYLALLQNNKSITNSIYQ